MGVRVLIVDDHPGFRLLARKLLEAGGYVVVGEADDGASAVAAAVALKPELVLLDVQLPDCDGFQVAQQLNDCAVAFQIVLISSRELGDYGCSVDQCGARGFLLKDELSAAALDELFESTD
jgi:DNA-binding NarL/FixJ family response regulator